MNANLKLVIVIAVAIIVAGLVDKFVLSKVGSYDSLNYDELG